MTEQNEETANDAAQDPTADVALAVADAAADAATTVAGDLALRNVCGPLCWRPGVRLRWNKLPSCSTKRNVPATSK